MPKLSKKILISVPSLVTKINNFEDTLACQYYSLEVLIESLLDAYVHEVVYRFDAEDYISECVSVEEFGLMDDIDYSMENSRRIEEIQAVIYDFQSTITNEIIEIYTNVFEYLDMVLNTLPYQGLHNGYLSHIDNIEISSNNKDVTAVLHLEEI